MLEEKELYLDPRVEIILLLIANVISFIQRSIYVEVVLIAALGILVFSSGCHRAALKLILTFILLLILKYNILPTAPGFIRYMFSVFLLYLRKIFPCIMIGTLIVKTTPVKHIICAFKKWGFPQQIIIPLFVTMRYFPAIKEEIMHIRDAMKLRKLSGIKKIEYYLVPLMISATNTAEELSAAAVTRGIENPVKKTSIIDIRLRSRDYLCLVIGLIFIVVAALMR